jgi:erythromycin esterase
VLLSRLLAAVSALLLTLGAEDTSAAASRRRPVERAASAEVQWLRARAIGLASTEPAAPLDDLLPLKPLFQDVEAITLGEGTHFTHEFQTMHHRLARFFAEELGARVFTFEAGWAEFLAIDDYLRTGQGDPAALLENDSWVFWDTEEMLELVRWARAWNASHAESELISILGVDPAAPGWPQLRAHVIEYLRAISPQAAATATEAYACFASVPPYAYKDLAEPARAACRASLRSVAEHLTNNRALYEQTTGARAFAAAARSAEMVLQGEQMAAAGYGPEYHTLRDEAMAANVLSLRREKSPDRPIVFRGHNAHASANGYDAGEGRFESAGSVLRSRVGPALVAIGTTSSHGTYLASAGSLTPGIHPFPTPRPGSWELIFDEVGYAAMILSLRGDVPQWTGVPRPFFSFITVGRAADPASYAPSLSLPPMFDAIIYVRETTPTHLLH